MTGGAFSAPGQAPPVMAGARREQGGILNALFLLF